MGYLRFGGSEPKAGARRRNVYACNAALAVFRYFVSRTKNQLDIQYVLDGNQPEDGRLSVTNQQCSGMTVVRRPRARLLMPCRTGV